MKLSRQVSERIAFGVISLAAVVVVIPIFYIIGYIVVQSADAVSWSFLSEMPRDGMRAGGVLPAVVGYPGGPPDR